VFLFDVTVLKESAFANGLRSILESEKVAKLFFDVRCDADALFHLYNIKANNVLDMQVLCQKVKGGDSPFVQGIAKAVGHVVSASEKQIMEDVKHAGHGLFGETIASGACSLLLARCCASHHYA
jgi:exonuclease 3'-5' domain-containing protein 1